MLSRALGSWYGFGSSENYKNLFWKSPWTGSQRGPGKPRAVGWRLASVSPSPQSSVLSASELTPLSSQEQGKVEHFLSGQRGVEGRTGASLRMAKTRQGHRGTAVGSPRQF